MVTVKTRPFTIPKVWKDLLEIEDLGGTPELAMQDQKKDALDPDAYRKDCRVIGFIMDDEEMAVSFDLGSDDEEYSLQAVLFEGKDWVDRELLSVGDTMVTLRSSDRKIHYEIPLIWED